MTPKIDFWFSIGSTYTYLTVARLAHISQQSEVEFAWRPFSVRAIMQEMNNAPFVGKPAKEKYMWRDLQRRGAKYGLNFEVPVQYPLNQFDRANRIAVVAQREGWCEQYVVETYELWFHDGLPAGDDANLEICLAKAGQDYQRVLDLAATTATERAYEEATAHAKSLGIFGSPSFVVNGDELFWGDDRLEDAVQAAL